GAAPHAVAGGLTFVALSPGGDHTCGVTTARVAYCWGGNFNGGLGDGTTADRTTPVVVIGVMTFETVSAADAYTCGITAAGSAYCWGYNAQGQLGDGSM